MSKINSSTFTFIHTEKLCALIASATTRVVYAASSIAESVATSLCHIAPRVTLHVVIDRNPEVFRLGLGEQAGLALLMQNSIAVYCAEGLRIGVLIVDDNAWIFAPTPEIIFDQPTESTRNAVQVSPAFAEQLLLAIAPEMLDAHTTHAPGIGTQPITPQDVATIDRELLENPPQKFEDARKVRVYQGYFQFVELSLVGCQLNRHTINIPASLLNISDDNVLRERVRSTCKLVDDTSDFTRKIKSIEAKVASIRKRYTKSLGKDYGVVMLKRVRKDFEEDINLIRLDLDNLREVVREELQKEIAHSRDNLLKMLLPGVMKNPPAELCNQLFGPLTEETGAHYITDELNKKIPDVETLLGEMKLNCLYKDVTFEMLNDSGFIKAIETSFPYNNFAQLYAEQETMRAR